VLVALRVPQVLRVQMERLRVLVLKVLQVFRAFKV
jgi:hypothetical protein